MRAAGAVTAITVITACSGLARTADTTAACTAALELHDRLANAQQEEPAIEEFVEAAEGSQNPELVAIADRARRANEREDYGAVEAAVADAKSECEETGGI